MAAEEKSDAPVAVMKDQARFDELMAHAPDNDALRASLTKLWSTPPLEPMRRAFAQCDSEDEARRILFFPEAKDGEAYATIIKYPRDGLPHARSTASGSTNARPSTRRARGTRAGRRR